MQGSERRFWSPSLPSPGPIRHNHSSSPPHFNTGLPPERFSSSSASCASSESNRAVPHPNLRGDRNFHRSDRSGRDSDERRNWIFSTAAVPPSAGRFVVVSYNILGADNASQHWRELYSHIPPFIMDWDRRKGKILFELGLWSPDVLCLQEVDRFDDFQHELVQRGYEGIFKGRTGGSSDGCAMFWRTQKFCLLEEESIQFNELDLRNNVAQLCVLQARHKKRRSNKSKRTEQGDRENCVVVCNIHVLFNPNRGDIKIGQIRHLLKKAHALSKKWGRIPIVVAGDFNSIPQSPLYLFLRTSMLDVSCFDRRNISGQVETSSLGQEIKRDCWMSTSRKRDNQVMEVNASASSLNFRSFGTYLWTPEELKTATGDPNENIVKHKLNLESVYASIQGPVETRDVGGEPLVTTYHGRFMGTVDYIWFSEGLIPIRVLDFLPVHVLQRTKGLPSKKWGSDHMALACEFAFLTSQGGTTEDDGPVMDTSNQVSDC